MEQVETLGPHHLADIAGVGFVDAKRFNFRLKESSPVIDMGLEVTKYFSDSKEFQSDFYGAPRKQGDHYDIGVAEYQPSGFRHWWRSFLSSSD